MAQHTLLNYFSLVKANNLSYHNICKPEKSHINKKFDSPRRNLNDYFQKKAISSSKTPDKRHAMEIEILPESKAISKMSSSEFMTKWLRHDNKTAHKNKW